MVLALSPKYLCVHASFVCQNIEKKLCFSFFEGENSLFLMVNVSQHPYCVGRCNKEVIR